MPTLAIVPSKAIVAPGKETHFRVAEPATTSAVEWSVVGDGTIDASGKYTAPSDVAGPLTVMIRAIADGMEGTSQLTVTVQPAGTGDGSANGSGRPDDATQRDGHSVPSGDDTTTPGGTAQSPAAGTAAAGEVSGGAGARGSGSDVGTTAGQTSQAGEVQIRIAVVPSSIVLGAKGQQRFEARDATGQSVTATWSLVGTGSLPADVVGSIDTTTGAYGAPAEVVSERTVIVQATAEGGTTDKAFVLLTPGAIRMVPPVVTLRAGEKQQFRALIQGDPKGTVEWIPSPQTGELNGESVSPAAIVYTAPMSIREDSRLVIAAISKQTNTVGYANITLLADEWNGEGPRRIGLWLLLLAIVVPVLYLFWPPPTAADRVRLVEAQNAQAAAEAVRQERQQAVTANTAALSQAIDDWNKAQADLGAQQELKSANNPALVSQLEARAATSQSRADTARAMLTAAQSSLAAADRDVSVRTNATDQENQSQKENRRDETHLFLLVFLAGALGSFVHTTRSFVDFVGNRRLRPSWSWWYVLQPFTGAALAMVMYFVVRGGFFSTTTGAGSVNPWGVVAVAALVGLFSKQATNKLDELFTTMFRTDKDRDLRDKLHATPSTPTQSDGASK